MMGEPSLNLCRKRKSIVEFSMPRSFGNFLFPNFYPKTFIPKLLSQKELVGRILAFVPVAVAQGV